jgi:predicted DNA-binding transcriptional regulator YafY
MNDACLRRIQTLRLLPKAPARIGVTRIHEALVGQGFEIDKRSIQRDLNTLSTLFAIESDGNKDIPGWYWKKDAEKLELPEMEPAVALSFKMVRGFLERFMPPSTLADLREYFQHADQVLNNLPENHLADWSDKVALLSRSQPLLSPVIAEDVLNQVYTALLTDKQLIGQYRPRHQHETKSYTLNPLGLVVLDKVIYLLATVNDYRDVRQFALHRFHQAEVTKDNAVPLYNFNLQRYIQQGKFEYLVSGEQKIKLKLAISETMAFHLTETPLNENQTIKRDKTTDRLILRAEVKNTQQLRWWLMSFGAEVEVLAPKALRHSFTELSQKLVSLYGASNDNDGTASEL